MKKLCILAVSIVLAVSVFSGCDKKGESSSEEATNPVSAEETQRKTEKEVVRVSQGMLPQVIEKNVTYVQKQKDGPWEVESSEIRNWGWEEDFVITDTAWVMEAKDATSLCTYVNSVFAGKEATLYLYLRDYLVGGNPSIDKETDGTPKLDISLNMVCDIIFECEGETFYFEEIKILGAVVYEEGTTILKFMVDGQDEELRVPSDVRKSTWEEFVAALPSPEDQMRAQSQSYIYDVAFSSLPSFTVTSKNLTDYVWDDKITNTKYGENLSPELTWEKVDGATMYVVIMIDGNWLHMDVYTTETSLAEGTIGKGTAGQQYVGPYPPSGTHTYSVFVFALKAEMGYVEMHFDAGSNVIDKIYKGLDTDKDGNAGNVLAYGRLDGNYTHKD